MSCEPADRLMQSLRVRVPGATDDMLSLELFNAMDEFFRRTNAWRYKTEIELDEAKTEYNFFLPGDAVVVRAIGVQHNGVPIAPASGGGSSTSVSVGTLVPELTFPDGDASFAPAEIDIVGGLFTYAIYRPDYIIINNPPDAEAVKYPLVMWLALSVHRCCLDNDTCGDWQIEEWMWDMYFEDFLDGTLGRMYAMPAKPWSTPTHAVYHGKRFRNAMAMRRQEANRGFVYRAPGAWRFPRGSM